jgi:hypothetical protein
MTLTAYWVSLPERGRGFGENLQGIGEGEVGPLPRQDDGLARTSAQDSSHLLHDALFRWLTVKNKILYRDQHTNTKTILSLPKQKIFFSEEVTTNIGGNKNGADDICRTQNIQFMNQN